MAMGIVQMRNIACKCSSLSEARRLGHVGVTPSALRRILTVLHPTEQLRAQIQVVKQ